MLLSELWFLLVGVLFVGFVFLEGFDFGIGMSTKFLARNDKEKRLLINAIGPFWDANEVWLLTAGGAMFAAFPHWYATLFSGFYLPFVVLLLALIVRGVAFEFRHKIDHIKWTNTWDLAIFVGSILPPFLLGVMFSCLIQGLPIDENMNMYASFFDIVNVYSVVGGIGFVLVSYLHGLMFATLKVEGELRERARLQAIKLYYVIGAALVLFVVLTYVFTDVFSNNGLLSAIIYALVVVLYVALLPLLKGQKEGLSFTVTGLIIALVVSSFFVGLFPNVMISSIDPAYSMAITEASSGDYSLKIMTVVAAIMVPIVLAYQTWSYYIYRERVSDKEHLEY